MCSPFHTFVITFLMLVLYTAASATNRCTLFAVFNNDFIWSSVQTSNSVCNANVVKVSLPRKTARCKNVFPLLFCLITVSHAYEPRRTLTMRSMRESGILLWGWSATLCRGVHPPGWRVRIVCVLTRRIQVSGALYSRSSARHG